MFIDLHMHEKTYSKDSFLSLEEMVTIAKGRGLQAICITDHDSMGLMGYAREYSERTGFPIFTGVEYYSLEGDIVAFGVHEFPKTRISAQEFVNQVKAQGGFTVSAHPFRNNNRGLAEHLCEIQGLDGVEVLNGSTAPEANQLAYEYADQLDLVKVGASDCHIPEKVGICATWFPGNIHTMEEFLRALKSGTCRPAYYKHGSYRIQEPARHLAAV